MKKYNVKPTKKQRRAFENIERGMNKRQAMLKAGYSNISSLKPRQNLTGTRGYTSLVEEYRGNLQNAGISLDILSEIQAEGLFDQNAAVRLGYLKETKKDFGLDNSTQIQINNSNSFLAEKRALYNLDGEMPNELKEKYDFKFIEPNEGNRMHK